MPCRHGSADTWHLINAQAHQKVHGFPVTCHVLPHNAMQAGPATHGYDCKFHEPYITDASVSASSAPSCGAAMMTSLMRTGEVMQSRIAADINKQCTMCQAHQMAQHLVDTFECKT
jgi:hypothetical protein